MKNSSHVSRLVNGALVAHEDHAWIEANGKHVRVWILYVDLENQLSNAVKYIPLRDATKQLIHPSLVDLVSGREDRVEESFQHLFKDGTVTIGCQLEKCSHLNRDNFPKMQVYDRHVVKIFAASTADQQEFGILQNEPVQTKITKYFK